MIHCVLDSNVLISGVRYMDSIPGKILQEWKAKNFHVILSQYIFVETERAFLSKFFMDPIRTQTTMRGFQDAARMVHPANIHLPKELVEQKDQPIIGTAVAGGAEVIVTGDAMLLSLGQYLYKDGDQTRSIDIMNPRDFLGRLQE